MPTRPRLTLADLAPGRSNVSRIILEGGRAQADAALRGGDAWANAIGNVTQTVTGGLQQWGQARDEAQVQKAVRASAVPAGGAPPDLHSILSGLPDELKGRAMKGVQEIQTYASKVQENGLQIKKLQSDLADAETKRKTVAGDYGAGLGHQITQWLPGQDGGLSAALLGLGNAKGIGTQGLEEIEPVLQGLAQEWEAAKASGDPAAIAAAAEKNRQAIGPIAQKLVMGGSPEFQERIKPKTAKLTTLNPDGSSVEEIVEDRPGVSRASAAKPGTPEEEFIRSRFGPRPTAEQRLKARKEWEAQNDRPQDPLVAEMARLRIDEARAKAAGAVSQGDTVADAWAGGMAFPSTQEATTAALESFKRRGLPVPRKLSTPMQQEAIRTADTLAHIEDVEKLYEKVKGVTGPVSYTLAEWGTKLPGIESNPDFVAFNTMLRSMGNLEIKRITGAAMSEKEADRLLKGMATGSLKPGDFEAALGIMKRNAKRNKDVLLYGKVSDSVVAPSESRSGAPKRVTKEEFDKLPSGARFLDPHGEERIKP